MPTMKRGGRSPLTETQQSLAVRYLPLARSLAKPFKMCWPAHRDDFESAACGALVEAAGTFDPERGVLFSTFARHRIWGGLRDVQRSVLALGWRCDPAHAPLITPLPKNPEGKGRVLGSDLEPPVGQEIEDIDAVECLLKRLPTRHARACRQVYLHGKTQHEAARVMGCSQARFSFLHREAMSILNGSWETQVLGDDGAEG